MITAEAIEKRYGLPPLSLTLIVDEGGIRTDPPLDPAQQAELAEAHAAGRAIDAPKPVAPSFADPVTGIRAGLSSVDLQQWSLDQVGYSSRLAIGEIDLEHQVEIRDVDGQPHTLSLREYLGLLGRIHRALRAQMGFREGKQ